MDGQGYSLVSVFNVVLLTLALWIGVRAITSAVKSRFLQVAIPDRGGQDAIATLMQIILTGIGLFLILQVLGIDLSALAILASVLVVGLGFGLISKVTSTTCSKPIFVVTTLRFPSPNEISIFALPSGMQQTGHSSSRNKHHLS